MGLLSKIRAALVSVPKPPAEPQASSEASDRPIDYYEQAFELAAVGIEWPPEARDAVRGALAKVIYDGEQQGNKALAAVWPDSFRWPDAELYLDDLGIGASSRQLMIMLRTQVSRAAHQLRRIEQMRLVAGHSMIRGNTHVLVAHTSSPDGISRCGLSHKETRSCEMAADMAPCLVFGCDCSWAALQPRHIK
ncbi:hypothetical protein HOP52_19255 [Halomonas campisalis]|uniref:Uncharacterized protein n=1 Tax=Billgrantia campisalis TaxID=74661 RepID=A0ABS9PDP6_9GAMM|nr:hypothetical protein [Halomonas campisalis]MCG6659884.1 hypothetical protein [Halomonas campisalis]MDR5865078.1 hypothetical protein [Halomonas campisalis]